MRCLLLLLSALAVVAQQSDGDNLETFPSIIDDLSTSSSSSASRGLFNPSTLQTAPGPALPPSSYLTSLPSSTSSSPFSSSSSAPSSRKTLISASSWNSSAHAATSTGSQSLEEIVVTETVSGSVTTETITNTAAEASSTGGSNAAARGTGTMSGLIAGGAIGAVAAALMLH
ncbi:hypothetical protein JCM8547_001349 [Rhodosporidiobolus lusitaniae]